MATTKRQRIMITAFVCVIVAAAVIAVYLARRPSTPERIFTPSDATDVTMFVIGGAKDGAPLPPGLAAQFVDMLRTPGTPSDISSMSAIPYGSFSYDGKGFLWHGNAVILVVDGEERLWSGPLLQRLVEIPFEQLSEEGELEKVLAELEADDTVADTPMEGPGAYPGGGDAFHPVETKDFKTFTPEEGQGEQP